MAKMSKSGVELAAYATSKIGTPYFYGSKMTKLTESFMAIMAKDYPKMVTPRYIAKARSKGLVGKVCVDCSGLIGSYRGKQLGSSQLYSTASKRLPIANVKDFPIGTVLWKSGHVGVFVGYECGIPMCVEAKGIDYGTIMSKVSDTKWQYGLLFSDMSYDEVNIGGNERLTNPYTEPTRNIKKGCKGEDVKWVQFELKESGYDIKIDGIYGSASEKACKSFQTSAKLLVDGIVGKNTRNAMKLK